MDCHVKLSLPLQDSLKEVKVVGSWDGWKAHHPLQRNEDAFEASLSLPEGLYEFKFIMDGRWTTNDGWPLSNDGHGNANNVLNVTMPEVKIDEVQATEEVRNTNVCKSPRRLR